MRIITVVALLVASASSAFGGSATHTSAVVVYIPDGSGQYAHSPITISEAPADRVVTSIVWAFEIIHADGSDLDVDLNDHSQTSTYKADLWKGTRLAGGTDSGVNPTRGGAVTSGPLIGLPVNQTWYLAAADVLAPDQGYIKSWGITINWDDPPPSGACCISNNCYTDYTQANCQNQSGVWQANSTTCQNCTAPPPTGACCISNNCYTGYTQVNCQNQSGVWQANSTTCQNCTAPPPTGACCISNNCYTDYTQANCQNQSGVWQANSTTCQNCAAPPPTGACCISNNCYTGYTQANCQNQSGVWQANSTTCQNCTAPPPTGACCINNNCYTGYTQANCQNQSGVWQANSTTCQNCTSPPPPNGFYLTFPLNYQNWTPYSAKITSVFDHSMDKPYCPLDGVVSYKDEVTTIRGTLVAEFTRDCNGDGVEETVQLYGYANASTTLYYDGHPGYDYGVPDGHNVYAAATGIVDSVGNQPDGLGHYIKIYHPSGGYQTLYGHLAAPPFMSTGGVTRGELIGTSGHSGKVTGAHLHFEVRKRLADGKWIPVDPYGWEPPGADPDPYTVLHDVTNEVLWGGSGGGPESDEDSDGVEDTVDLCLGTAAGTKVDTNGCAIECTSTADCNDGDPCTNDVCVNNTCTNPRVSGCCIDDADCDAGEVCADGRCVCQSPAQAAGPSPVNGAMSASLTPTIRWQDVTNATSYDVYFGTDPSPDAGEFVLETDRNRWTPTELEPNTTYYWRIDAVNDCDLVRGPIWRFTTRGTSSVSEPPVGQDSPICVPGTCGAGCSCTPGAPTVGLIFLGLIAMRFVGSRERHIPVATARS